MNPEALAQVADYFKLLSEPSRLQVLCALRQGPLSVSEIVAQASMGQANVSKHLKLLAQAGMLRREPRGGCVYYEICDPTIFELCEVVSSRLAARLAQQQEQLTAWG
jgi:DNA-binding transcriptional ArsR family regulator